ncbi:hypothetical protein DFH29DRAFT_1005299 [Suillus ampliporus]|nr:hypothetical protein DFH29DRAFT_1005299 [Suillus ampliporus]
MKDDYLGLTVKCEVDNHYRDNRKNLFVQGLHMRMGVHVSESRKLAEGVQFMKRNIEGEFPPNTYVIIDTHSDEYSGMLQHTGGHTGGTNTNITEIVTAYLGKEFLKGMENASVAARNDKTVVTTERGKQPWCNLTAKARGGRRVLLLVSCGPAIRVHHHFDSVVELVNKDVFDFVLGFGGSGTLPSFVSSVVRSLVVESGVFGGTDMWASFCSLIASNQSVLDYTTAVLVYAVTVDGKRHVECRQIAKNMPGLRAFGAEYKSCGTAGCNPSPSHIRVFNRNKGRPKVSVRCLKCGWKSAWVRTDEDNKHFKRVQAVLAPQVFWHHFPPSTDLQNFFVDLTNKTKDESKVSSQPSGAKEGKVKAGKGKGKNKRHDMIDADMIDEEFDPIAMEVDR